MTPCVEHKGATQERGGHGLKWYRGKMWKAHRAAWTAVYGPIPKGLVIIHACDNPRCVNVEHLSVGTQKENVHDCMRKGRKVSQKGERNSQSKLDRATVDQIHLEANENGTRVTARKYGLSVGHVSNIRNGKVWTTQ